MEVELDTGVIHPILVEYEWRPISCTKCSTFGHKCLDSSPANDTEIPANAQANSQVDAEMEVVQETAQLPIQPQEGWKTVERRKSRPKNQVSKTALMQGKQQVRAGLCEVSRNPLFIPTGGENRDPPSHSDDDIEEASNVGSEEDNGYLLPIAQLSNRNKTALAPGRKTDLAKLVLTSTVGAAHPSNPEEGVSSPTKAKASFRKKKGGQQR